MAKERIYEPGQAHRNAVRRYERNNERLNLTFPKGTMERIKALDSSITCSSFIRDAVLEKLHKLDGK